MWMADDTKQMQQLGDDLMTQLPCDILDEDEAERTNNDNETSQGNNRVYSRLRSCDDCGRFYYGDECIYHIRYIDDASDELRA